MAWNHFLLMLALPTTLVAGCLDGPADDMPTAEAGPTIEQDSETRAGDVNGAAQTPDCATVTNNYGVSLHIAGQYYVDSSEGMVNVYIESNGKRHLQTPSTCPGNHDTKVTDADLIRGILAAVGLEA